MNEAIPNGEYLPQVGDAVEWVSTLTGRHHTGHIVHGDNGLGMVLVRPDQRGYDWSAWEPVNVVTPSGSQDGAT